MVKDRAVVALHMVAPNASVAPNANVIVVTNNKMLAMIDTTQALTSPMAERVASTMVEVS